MPNKISNTDMTVLETLGESIFSRTFLIQNSSGTYVRKEYKSGLVSEARREYMFLQMVKGDGIVSALTYGEDQNPWLLMEYITGDPLTPGHFTNPKTKYRFYAQLASILAKIHSCGIVLNDLKPTNLLIMNEKPVFLDLGLATVNLYQDANFRGTKAYAAPEKILRHTNHQAGDIFSLGMIIYFLEKGATLVDQVGIESYQSYLNSEDLWRLLLQKNIEDEFLKSMLGYQAKDRPAAYQIARHYAELGSLACNELPLYEIQSISFKSQQAAVERLWTKRQLKCQFADEPFHLEQLLSLWTESSGRKLLVLDERVFISQPDLFFQSFPIGYRDKSVFRDLFIDWISEQPVSLLLKRSKSKGLSSFFDELAEFPNSMVLWDSQESDVKVVSSQEIKSIVDSLNLSDTMKQQILKQIKSSRAFHLRLALTELLRKKAEHLPENELIDFLSWLETPIPVSLAERAWDNWYQLIQDGIIKHRLRMEGDQIRVEKTRKSETEPPRELLQKVDAATLQDGQYYISGLIHYNLGEYEQAMLSWVRHVDDLSQKQFYFSAYEFLRHLHSIVPHDSYPFELRKKEAFIARIVGHFDEAMNLYTQLRKETEGVSEAVLAVDQAIVLQSLNRYDEAITIYQEAIDLFKKNQDWKATLRAMNNLGAVYFGLQRYFDAERLFNDVLQQARAINNLQFETISFLNLADIYLKRGDWNKALFFTEKAIAITVQNQKWNLQVNGTILMCRALFAQGESDKAIQILKEILSDNRCSENPMLTSEIKAWLLHITEFCTKEETDNLYNELLHQNEPEQEILIRELFFSSYCRKHYWQAVQMASKLDKVPMLKYVLDDNMDAIRERLQELKKQQEIDSYLYYALHLMRTGLITEDDPIYEEIWESAELFTYEPLRKFKKQKIDIHYRSSDVLEYLWMDISRAFELPVAIEKSLELITRITHMERTVYLEYQNATFKTTAAMNHELKPIELDSLIISQSILQNSIKIRGVQFFSHMYETTPVDLHSSILGLGLRYAFCCPIYARDQIMGIFYGDSREEMTQSEEDKQVIRITMLQIQNAMERLLFYHSLQERSEVTSLEHAETPSHQMVGSSKVMQEVLQKINMVARYNVNVLIAGPTGSGKELVARAIHEQFAEQTPFGAKTPFIAVNCAAIPETLLESELFGYRKGAFTGATNDKKGKIESADKGTLFLDEIGEMPLLLQAKLLRVIQDKMVTPLGSNQDNPVDVRIITATNRSLDDQVANGHFRADLYYRLKVVTIDVPGLTERREDIPLLIHAFMKKFNQKFGKNVEGIHPRATQYLQQQEWKGNVRELENTMERAILLCQREYLSIDDFQESEDAESPTLFAQVPLVWSEYQEYRARVIDELDIRYVKHLLEKTEDNVMAASKLGQLERVQIYRLMKKK
ncbi:MAG TPA: sigma 54-interacting transcriptional regulator [Candidatus Cloacimonadota bacterium]|nr:sigma 54-interacting transcriptional regulator [Candidatus Cloacimonadota bacterium]HPT71979.1 sigma 54-interacting transcriptional regulator [Candidatus Cloacimonadota bacterium]